jgi:hypothetical protein
MFNFDLVSFESSKPLHTEISIISYLLESSASILLAEI